MRLIKPFALIALSAFSIVTNAEVFLCSEIKAVSLDKYTVRNPPVRDKDEVVSSFLVDPERGYKRVWLNDEYNGSCSLETRLNVLTCIQKPEVWSSPSTLIMGMSIKPYSFTYVAQTPYAIYSYAGECIEL